MLHLRKRGSRYSQSKYFDRGRQADRRGRSRRPCHRVHKHLWLNGHLLLREYAQILFCGQFIQRTVVLAGASGFGIAIAYAGNLATVLTPGLVAVPTSASGTTFAVAEACGFSLAIVRALFCRCERKRWRGSCIAFAPAVGITNAFASALGFSAVSACDVGITTAIAEACGFILAITRTRSRHSIPHGIDIGNRWTASPSHRHWCAVKAPNLYSNDTLVKAVKDKYRSRLPTTYVISSYARILRYEKYKASFTCERV